MKCIESIQARGKEQGQNIWHYGRKIIFKGFYYDLRSLFHELWTQLRFIYNPYFISHRIYGVSRYIYLIYIHYKCCNNTPFGGSRRRLAKWGKHNR
jgi:hypothetical protein